MLYTAANKRGRSERKKNIARLISILSMNEKAQ
jgi:hypothetical protein